MFTSTRNNHKFKQHILIISMMCITLLSGCSKYQFTFNETVVYQPPKTLTEFTVADRSLQLCLDQTIKDQQITSPQELKTLNCSSAGIATLDGLEIFDQLRQLNLANNSIESISTLEAMAQLTEVNLEGNSQLHCNSITDKLKQRIVQLVLPSHCLAPSINRP